MSETLATVHPAGLTPEDSWAQRTAAWVVERFPPKVAVVLLLPLSTAAFLVGGAVSGDSDSPWLPGIGLAFAGFVAFLLVVRICDEHKDFEPDCRSHPERVLQRGIVTLAQLRGLATCAVLGQLAITIGTAVWRDTVVPVVAWLVAAVWLALMTKEFFAHDYLVRRLPLYAASHMMLTPLAVYWIMSLGAAGAVEDGGTWPTGATVGMFCVLAYVTGLSLEVGRKLNAPGDEQPGVGSYTKEWGVRGASAVLAVTVVGATAVSVGVLHELRDGWSAWWSGAVVAPGLVALAAIATFGRSPEHGRGKQVETTVGLFVVAVYSVVAAAAPVTLEGQWV